MVIREKFIKFIRDKYPEHLSCIEFMCNNKLLSDFLIEKYFVKMRYYYLMEKNKKKKGYKKFIYEELSFEFNKSVETIKTYILRDNENK